MAAAYQFAFLDTTLVIYYPIASKFHTWISFIKLSPKFRYRLCRITKMATNMAVTCRFALVNTLSHLTPGFFQISQQITFIKLSHKL